LHLRSRRHFGQKNTKMKDIVLKDLMLVSLEQYSFVCGWMLVNPVWLGCLKSILLELLNTCTSKSPIHKYRNTEAIYRKSWISNNLRVGSISEVVVATIRNKGPCKHRNAADLWWHMWLVANTKFLDDKDVRSWIWMVSQKYSLVDLEPSLET